MHRDPATVDVIALNLKRRWSGVSSTVIRLVPLQAQAIAIAACGPRLPAHLPQMGLGQLVTMGRQGPHGARVLHARRNNEMILGLLLRHLLRKKLRLVFTSAREGRRSALTRWLVRRMDGVVATSPRAGAHLGVRVTVIRHGIDTGVFHPPADRARLRQRLGLAPDGVILGCFGRVRPDKGTGHLVDALIGLLPDRPGVEAVILGRITRRHADFAAGLTARIAAAGLDERVHVLPEVPESAMADWYGALDLLVAPSLKEGFGLTPLEAMACGTPVVATTAGAFEEMVVHEGTGLIVPVNDPSALQAAIARALDHPGERRAWGAAGPAHVAAHFRLEDEAAALNAIYRELLGIG
ncbi:MAG: glycosyltransferase family 4 protein [Rubellimicrobium sp.]|nr:glycosyltransferase family 4 protein [Rubellimicrobium sp.]